MGWMPGGPGAGGNAGAFDQGWHYTWGFDYGGKFADLAACKVTPTDPGVVAGYQFLYDWAKAHDPQAVSRWVTTNLPPNPPAAQNPFWTGKLGMTISGDWRIAEQLQYAPNGHYGFTYIPVPKAGDPTSTWAGGWSMALIPDSKVADQAVKFMQYIAGTPTVRRCTPRSRPTCRRSMRCCPTRPSMTPQHAQFLDPAADGQEPPAARSRRRLLGRADHAPGVRRAQHRRHRRMPSRRSRAPSNRSSTPSAASRPHGSATARGPDSRSPRSPSTVIPSAEALTWP